MNNDQYIDLASGMDVEASDGGKVGKVQEVLGDYVVVSKGFFFPQDFYIPVSAITSADQNTVYLNVTKDEALSQGWDAIPDTTTTVYADQHVVDNSVGTGTLGHGGGHDTYSTSGGDAPFQHEADTGHFETDEKIEIALSEEELTARTREVERGQVRIDKDVVVEEQTLDVPVTEEHVHLSRRVVDRDVLPGDPAFEEGTIEVPVYGEDVETEKRARVREEVELTKDRVQEVERVSGTVRHEEVRVTDDSGAIIDDTNPGRRR